MGSQDSAFLSWDRNVSVICRSFWSCPSSSIPQSSKAKCHLTDPALEVRGKTKSRISLNAVHSSQGHDPTGHTYEQVLKQPVSQEKSQGLRSEESSLHYADIQVCSLTQTRSAQEVKHLQLENATEYATLYFPQSTPCYDSKNGTLV